MKPYSATLACLLLSTSVFATLAQAGTIQLLQVPNGGTTDNSPSNLAGTNTIDIYVNAGATEQIGAIQIYAQLVGNGSFFQHLFGGNTPPNAALIPAFRNLAFDTFVASGQPVNTAFSPVIAGASADLGSPNSGGAVVFNNKTVDITYGPQAGQPTQGALGFLVGRFTLTGDSEGIFKMKVDFSGNGVDPVISGQIHGGIPNGMIDPEPASISLGGLAVLGIVGLVRRRS